MSETLEPRHRHHGRCCRQRQREQVRPRLWRFEELASMSHQAKEEHVKSQLENCTLGVDLKLISGRICII